MLVMRNICYLWTFFVQRAYHDECVFVRYYLFHHLMQKPLAKKVGNTERVLHKKKCVVVAIRYS